MPIVSIEVTDAELSELRKTCKERRVKLQHLIRQALGLSKRPYKKQGPRMPMPVIEEGPAPEPTVLEWCEREMPWLREV